MKIFVTNMPKLPSECSFSKKKKSGDVVLNKTSKPVYQYFCSISGKLCSLYCDEKCNKLKSLEKLLEDAYENYNRK